MRVRWESERGKVTDNEPPPRGRAPATPRATLSLERAKGSMGNWYACSLRCQREEVNRMMELAQTNACITIISPASAESSTTELAILFPIKMDFSRRLKETEESVHLGS